MRVEVDASSAPQLLRLSGCIPDTFLEHDCIEAIFTPDTIIDAKEGMSIKRNSLFLVSYIKTNKP